MSKLIFEKEEVVDTYEEHEAYHQSFHLDCSECFKERQAKKDMHYEMLRKYPALNNPYGRNYPLTYVPE